MPEPTPIYSRQFERLGGWLESPVEKIAPIERGTVSSCERQSRWSGSGALQPCKELDTLRAEGNAAFATLQGECSDTQEVLCSDLFDSLEVNPK